MCFILSHNLSFVGKENNCGCIVHSSRDRKILRVFLRVLVCACLFVVAWFIPSRKHSQPVDPYAVFACEGSVVNKVGASRRLIDAKTDHF